MDYIDLASSGLLEFFIIFLLFYLSYKINFKYCVVSVLLCFCGVSIIVIDIDVFLDFFMSEGSGGIFIAIFIMSFIIMAIYKVLMYIGKIE